MGYLFKWRKKRRHEKNYLSLERKKNKKMSLSLGGFGPSKADIRIRSLKCQDMQVIDRDCNLNVANASVETLRVEQDLSVPGNIIVCGEVRAKEGHKLVLGDTIINGVMFSAQDEFNASVTTTNSNVEIEVLPGLLGSSVMIEQTPCGGFIQDINATTGNVVYQSLVPLTLDLYRYSALDECGIRHSVTQYICKTEVAPMVMPPILNNECVRVGIDIICPGENYFLGQIDASASAVPGTNPIDWSTLTFKAARAFSSQIFFQDQCNDPAGLPYGTNNAPAIAGPGVQIGPAQFLYTAQPSGAGPTMGQFLVLVVHLGGGLMEMQIMDINLSGACAPSNHFVAVDVEVMDTTGVLSNCATYYFQGEAFL